MAAFLADHNFEDEIVDVLIAAGHDVIMVRSIGTDRSSDPDILAAALAAGRTVLTHDRDFLRLHKSGAPHAGIVFASHDDDKPALAGRIHVAVSVSDPLDGRLIRICRPV